MPKTPYEYGNLLLNDPEATRMIQEAIHAGCVPCTRKHVDEEEDA
jgi:hypothetical protein